MQNRGQHIAITEGDVQVAVFTISDKKANVLPRTKFCLKWNRSITFRNALFNVSACRGADVVLFSSGRGFTRHRYWKELQKERTSNQLWLLSSAESAINTIAMWPPVNMRFIKMNLSCTFNSASDIYVPYGNYVPFKEKLQVPFRSKLLNDSQHLVVWVASHCPLRTWNRTGFVHDLSRHIPVHKFGECGNFKCERRDKRCNRIFRSYKFYLALENSCCRDYITEKFWEALASFDAIPVVLGASKEDYERVAPPNSFIHVDDFASVKDLAKYLKAVASNLTLFQSYFEWKNHGYIRWHKFYQFVWESEEHSCKLLEYAKGVRPLSVNGFDPFGSTWFGSCKACGKQSWLHEYYLHPFQKIYDSIHNKSNTA
ncbi:Glycoprotein 3-alpha-L-fucosyltransferase A [Holothuria leucospilota]|uniref:Fucosyltransferase n=1 Tax=Holothuria leucospilota TaxID=206669 RepID=A0A9Q1C0C7_HOLLE|nr:Glycoprotein 3-alpha-L-fucosyltransferase A [Holothuria leucospilota]